MANIQVILTQDVSTLGRAGELVKVKAGYGRNFLIPRGMALIATRGNVARAEHQQRAIARDQERLRVQHQAVIKRLESATVSVARKVGENGKLFGSVGSKDIADALAAQDVEIDRKWIHLSSPLREVGVHEVEVRLSAETGVTLRVNVVGI